MVRKLAVPTSLRNTMPRGARGQQPQVSLQDLGPDDVSTIVSSYVGSFVAVYDETTGVLTSPWNSDSINCDH